MDDNTQIQLTRGELKALLQEAVTDALVKLGMDIEDPLEMQRDFQHLREWRVAVAAMRTKGVLTILGLILAGLAAAVVVGVKVILQTPA